MEERGKGGINSEKIITRKTRRVYHTPIPDARTTTSRPSPTRHLRPSTSIRRPYHPIAPTTLYSHRSFLLPFLSHPSSPSSPSFIISLSLFIHDRFRLPYPFHSTPTPLYHICLHLSPVFLPHLSRSSIPSSPTLPPLHPARSFLLSFFVPFVQQPFTKQSLGHLHLSLQLLMLCPFCPQSPHVTFCLGPFSADDTILLTFGRPRLLVQDGGFIPSSGRLLRSTGIVVPT